MSTAYRLYGIANCDTVKKARNWLALHGFDYQFHDFKTAGIPHELQDWLAQLGWEKLLKKTGTTWRNLPELERTNLDSHRALILMQQHYNLIKRPLLIKDKQVLLTGFKEIEWSKTLT
jgi:arsenate reductase